MNKSLPIDQKVELLELLKVRFDAFPIRHTTINWKDVLVKLEANPQKLWSLRQMEVTGGEPEFVGQDEATKEYLFYDCSKETPSERRSFCYDHEALESRKKFPPKNSAQKAADDMEVSLMTEQEYHKLQEFGDFDLKTSSWLKTPADVRSHGGAIFGDKRFGRVFIYHNGADSYYAARGFRTVLRV